MQNLIIRHMNIIRIIKLSTVALLLALTSTQAAFVWIEGESTYKSNIPQNPWMKGDNAKLLSGGDAFAGLVDHRDEIPNPAYALYKVAIAEAGNYIIYLRHGFAGNMGELRIRFVEVGADGKPLKTPGADEGWTKIDWDVPVMDQKGIGQFRSIEWSKQDAVKLSKGNYIMDIRLMGVNPKNGAADPPAWMLIDAICLTTEPFTPRGVLKPGEQPKAPEAGKGSENIY